MKAGSLPELGRMARQTGARRRKAPDAPSLGACSRIRRVCRADGGGNLRPAGPGSTHVLNVQNRCVYRVATTTLQRRARVSRRCRPAEPVARWTVNLGLDKPPDRPFARYPCPIASATRNSQIASNEDLLDAREVTHGAILRFVLPGASADAISSRATWRETLKVRRHTAHLPIDRKWRRWSRSHSIASCYCGAVSAGRRMPVPSEAALDTDCLLERAAS
jgi:hypothetical protein